jgi:hypothetical protein
VGLICFELFVSRIILEETLFLSLNNLRLRIAAGQLINPHLAYSVENLVDLIAVLYLH